ncbi:MAG: DUF4190 domain-containing protein [candidate division WOR-3 bacterium]
MVPDPLAGRRAGAAGKGLAIASLVLGVIGLGIPAIILGMLVLVRKKPGQSLALAGVLVGALGTIALVAVISSAAATRRAQQALEKEEIEMAEVSVYTAAVNRQLAQLEIEAQKLEASLGELGEEHVNPVFAHIDEIRADLYELQQAEDDESVNEIRSRIRTRLAQVRATLDGH